LNAPEPRGLVQPQRFRDQDRDHAIRAEDGGQRADHAVAAKHRHLQRDRVAVFLFDQLENPTEDGLLVLEDPADVFLVRHIRAQ